jgi:hypothetical protein
MGDSGCARERMPRHSVRLGASSNSFVTRREASRRRSWRARPFVGDALELLDAVRAKTASPGVLSLAKNDPTPASFRAAYCPRARRLPRHIDARSRSGDRRQRRRAHSCANMARSHCVACRENVLRALGALGYGVDGFLFSSSGTFGSCLSPVRPLATGCARQEEPQRLFGTSSAVHRADHSRRRASAPTRARAATSRGSDKGSTVHGDLGCRVVRRHQSPPRLAARLRPITANGDTREERVPPLRPQDADVRRSEDHRSDRHQARGRPHFRSDRERVR